MKKIKLLTFLFAICVLPWMNIANAVEKQQTVPNGTTVSLNKDRGRRPHKRPEMPSRQMITCVYDNGELTIDFAMPEGMCEVMLTENTGAAMSYNVDSSDLTATVFVGTIGESEIELTTENGNTYTGILTAE